MVNIKHPHLAPLAPSHTLNRLDPPAHFRLALFWCACHFFQRRAIEVGEGRAVGVDGDGVLVEYGHEGRAEEGGGDVAFLVSAFVGAWSVSERSE
jgi:hypothetical protein